MLLPISYRSQINEKLSWHDDFAMPCVLCETMFDKNMDYRFYLKKGHRCSISKSPKSGVYVDLLAGHATNN